MYDDDFFSYLYDERKWHLMIIQNADIDEESIFLKKELKIHVKFEILFASLQ